MSKASESMPQTKSFNRPVSKREAVDAFKRLEPMRGGRPELIRFTLWPRIEHLILMITFGVLALTGLLQTFDNLVPVRQFLLLLGGLEAVQQIHHLFGLILCGLAVFHTLNILDGFFVRRETGKLLPEKSDFGHFIQYLTSNKLPLFERYSFDEKFVYWATFIGVGVLSITGLSMWFPTWITVVLPGSFFPYAVVIHRWQAIFAVVVIALLHTYQVLLRKKNISIFTGRMSIDDMREDHPVELAYLEKLANLVQAGGLPKSIEFTVEEHSPKKIYINAKPEQKPEIANEIQVSELIEATKTDQTETPEIEATLQIVDGETAT
jgi:cytochrome b subunit of formate dehydrogenase